MSPVHEPLPPTVSFPALEEQVLARWRERDVFRASVRNREGGPPFVFYEGPPTANGLPGSHHVLARVFKDVFPRFKTMTGHYVERKAGWDTHGLPVEIAVEQKLGFNTKEDIERYGVAEFNAKCREAVLEHLEDWRALTERIGYWVDLDDAYYTLDPSYVESVWWALKTMWDRDLLYEGHKVVPYCARCGTALSSHEVAQGYQDDEDPSVFVRFPVSQARRRAARGRRAARLDDDAVDARLERGGRRRPRADLRAHDLRRGARRGARRAGARRRRRDRGPVQRRRHGRRRLRAAVPVHPGRGLRRQGPHGAPRRLRQRRGRHRHRPHRDRVRRGGLPARGRAGPERRQPRPARRHLRRADRPVRRALGQGRRRRPDRGPARARPAAAGGDAAARLPALLALRDAAPLLRQAVVVHPHVGDARPPARRQRDRHLAPAAHQARALRQVAREQRRLGDLARALLGHAAAGLALRERPRRGGRLVRGGRGALGQAAARPAPAVRRRAHVGVRRVRRRDAPRPGGHRRLVRLRLDAVRAAPRPVRERGPVPRHLPGRLHLRGDRPDPRLVLLADRDLDAAVRPLALPHRALPRPHRRPAGQEDVEVARQHRRALGGHPAPRGRRVPLVLPDLEAAVGRLPVLDRDGRRVRAPVPAPALEHVRLLRPLRERERDHRAGRARDRPRPLGDLAAERDDRRGPRADGGLRRDARRPGDRGVRRRALELVRAALAAALLGRRPGRVRHAEDLPGRGQQAARPVLPVHRRRDLREPRRVARQRPPGRLPRGRASATWRSRRRCGSRARRSGSGWPRGRA